MTYSLPDYGLIAQRIKERREAKGMSKEKLAEAIGKSTRFINYVEIVEKYPSIRTLFRFADALDITPKFLIFGD
jgi:transcriptional regulator with XRE-family HTH domain